MKNNTTCLVCVHSTDDFHDRLLTESLNSLTLQTFKEFYTLVVLDECWDNTLNIVKLFENKLKMSYLIKEKKSGLGDAKNFGIKHITTDYITYLDADDLWMPKKLEKQVEKLKTEDIDFLGTHALNRRYGNPIFTTSCFDNNKYLTHDEIKEIIFKENILTHGSMMIKKKCIEDLGGYDNSCKGYEDWNLWQRAILKNYKFLQLSERLYVYTLFTSVAR